MEGNVVSSYLRRKFSSSLNEAEPDLSRYSQMIMSRFRSIEGIINARPQNSDSMVDPLYDLMDLLSDCTIEAASNSPAFLRAWNWETKVIERLIKIGNTLWATDPDQCHNTTTEGLYIEQAYPHPDPSQIHGFESQVAEIEGWLGDEEKKFKAIGIVGMCGCGKTALAQKVFASSTVEKMFFPRIWVSLSARLLEKESSDLRHGVLFEILRKTGHDVTDLSYGEYSVVQLQEKLHRRLMGKRYLIILEDVWRMEEWFADLGWAGQHPESFTHGLPKGSGGAVIVSSRGENVITRMVGENHVIRPRLTDDTCWKIFWHALHPDLVIQHHNFILKMKDSVINNCQGLPLAAKTLANVISNLSAEKT